MRYADWCVILAYLAGITWFGARFRHRQKNLKDYFLGGRTAPWWAIALSIVSAETSTLTIIGTPVLAFGGDFGFLQVVFGYLLVVPGLATTRAAGFLGSLAVVSLAVVLSLGIDGMIGMALYAAHRFESVLATILVVAVTLTMVFVERVVSAGRPLVPLEPPDDGPGVAPTHR